MKYVMRSNSPFSIESFELISELDIFDYQDNINIYKHDKSDDFIKYVIQPLLTFGYTICNILPTKFDIQPATKNIFLNNYLEYVMVEDEDFPIGLQLNFGIFSLLNIQITYWGITLGYSENNYQTLIQLIAQKSSEAMIELIYQKPSIFTPERYFNVEKELILWHWNFEKLVTEVTEWVKQYIPLVLLASSNDPMLAIRQYLSTHCYEYTLAECAEETGFEETDIERWLRIINRKKQVIIYGSPGTGKTFIAEKLAQHLIGRYGFSELVQFHPAYSYEDFIQGIRPQSEDGKLTYPLVPGRFLEFCKKAESYQDTCVLIIDEINRANLAQVFGELMYLLEYRDKEIPLAGGNTFRIPKNVRIIGTMNTADRSITQFDYALRRRFAFIELRPNYDVLEQYHLKTGFAVKELIEILQRLNQAIADKNYEIGISFFLTDNLREDIEDIWCMEIEPYLEEDFFNQLDKVDEFRWNKVKQLWI